MAFTDCIYMWHLHKAFTYGIYMWHLHMAFTYGIYRLQQWLRQAAWSHPSLGCFSCWGQELELCVCVDWWHSGGVCLHHLSILSLSPP